MRCYATARSDDKTAGAVREAGETGERENHSGPRTPPPKNLLPPPPPLHDPSKGTKLLLSLSACGLRNKISSFFYLRLDLGIEGSFTKTENYRMLTIQSTRMLLWKITQLLFWATFASQPGEILPQKELQFNPEWSTCFYSGLKWTIHSLATLSLNDAKCCKIKVAIHYFLYISQILEITQIQQGSITKVEINCSLVTYNYTVITNKLDHVECCSPSSLVAGPIVQ